jgi:ATP-dependent DNA ligase
MIAYKDRCHVRLISRRGVNHTQRFADIAAAVARLPGRTLVLDGEVCSFDERLVSHMHLLMDPPDGVVTLPIFMVFDCLYVRGRDVHQAIQRSPEAPGEIDGSTIPPGSPATRRRA